MSEFLGLAIYWGLLVNTNQLLRKKMMCTVIYQNRKITKELYNILHAWS